MLPGKRQASNRLNRAGQLVLKRASFAPDAASSGCSSLVLHRWLATPQSASAACRAVVSALPGSRPRYASDRRRSYRAAQRRLHRVQARPAPQPMRRLPQWARQEQYPPAHPSARMAPLPTLTTPGTPPAHRGSSWPYDVGSPRATAVSRARLIVSNARHSGRIAYEIDPALDRHEVDDGPVLRRERLDVSSAVLVRFSERVLAKLPSVRGHKPCLSARRRSRTPPAVANHQRVAAATANRMPVSHPVSFSGSIQNDSGLPQGPARRFRGILSRGRLAQRVPGRSPCST
jgi:hypothetical protein